MKNVYLIFFALFCLSNTIKAQVPKLNSYTPASAVIFLDFDGHLVQGTSWNYNGPFYCDGANMNTAQVTEVFNRVAEDYRPFNINVTTDSAVYEAAPARQRTRVVLTTSSSWYGTAGGVAFTHSFTWGDNTPCFVFTALHKYNLKNIAEATAHEIGHTLGLNHQSSYDATCNKTAEYNPGTGTGETGWAPIMGVGYYRNLTLWHFGTNPWGCSYMQDDLGIITSAMNGFGYREDDYGNTMPGATPLFFNNQQITLNGIIEQPNDADVFTFVLNGRSTFKVDALPYNIAAGYIGANVDMQVELTNGKDLQVYNPADLLRASIDTVLPAGTWYLRVLSKGNAFAPDFASLGSYTLSASVASTTLPLHKLELKGTSENNHHRLRWEIIADEKVVEQTVEQAADGQDFQPLAPLSAAARNFAYLPESAPQHYYRLRVKFDDGRTYYSNVISLRNNGTGSRPHLVSNRVTSALSIISPASYQYAIFDLNGRTLASGRLTQGLNYIATSFIPNGIYIIRYYNNQEQYTEKFSKQ